MLVRAVEDGSAADRAGLERGDLIVAAGETEIDRVDALYEALDERARRRHARADRSCAAPTSATSGRRSRRPMATIERDGRATTTRPRREAEALDAYSRVVVDVAERLAPWVANLRVMRRARRRVGPGRRRKRGRADARRVPADLGARGRRAGSERARGVRRRARAELRDRRRRPAVGPRGAARRRRRADAGGARRGRAAAGRPARGRDRQPERVRRLGDRGRRVSARALAAGPRRGARSATSTT